MKTSPLFVFFVIREIASHVTVVPVTYTYLGFGLLNREVTVYNADARITINSPTMTANALVHATCHNMRDCVLNFILICGTDYGPVRLFATTICTAHNSRQNCVYHNVSATQSAIVEPHRMAAMWTTHKVCNAKPNTRRDLPNVLLPTFVWSCGDSILGHHDCNTTDSRSRLQA